MRVTVSGASGLVGSALCDLLRDSGHDVVRMVRGDRRLGLGEIPWDPDAGVLDKDWLEGCDAVVHLAGENIAAGRWSAAQKARIRNSRILGTQLVANALKACNARPKVFFCASAVGYYGHRGDAWLDETSGPGRGFLPETCVAWEAAANEAEAAGIRVVTGRIGVVLSPRGGALAKMLTPFKLGAGGVIGSGRQYWSWITLPDLAAAILHALANESLRGAVNLVSPAPATNREFTRALGAALNRPTILPMPALMARVVLGEMANDLLLASARVRPARLLESGFAFKHAQIAPALKAILVQT
ncbi:MAG: TIGR01777 family oxidoreductase [Phycisphaerae bacterium]|nr:MAG: TIGR01777 family protein [Planctomycetota bacterium]KAB2941129.1 MAG: TIGR01777 family protein [Phycisphaerae bacterium]MBE7456939.1 TIGR01777 family protein [Planctomycetia bacterium]MCK6466240.1 TIGR01777 family oxidoreductase [Phycisphaerae bacterium]MCL4719989.1 TIGR01777 family oxidoreductase [Phycisphaerae bacterium]